MAEKYSDKKFIVGDCVKVVRKVKTEDGGWNNAWTGHMSKAVGSSQVYTVSDVSGNAGYSLEEDESCRWPSQALELAEVPSFQVGDQVKVVRGARGHKYCGIEMIEALAMRIGNDEVYTVREIAQDDANKGAVLLKEVGLWFAPHWLALAEEKKSKRLPAVRKVAFYYHNEQRAAAMELELGPRGSAVLGEAQLSKAKTWLCAATGARYESIDDFNAEDLEKVYNDVTNSRLRKIAADLSVAVVTPAAAKLAEIIMNAMPHSETSIAETVERIVAEKMAPRIVVLDKRDPDNIVERDLGQQHYKMPLLLTCVKARVHAALVGGAGTGKTTTGQKVADILGLKFYPKSFSRMTTESALMGYMDAAGNYHRTVFRDAFEHGGVFLADEFDAGNENVNVALNAALANDFCSFPDGVVKRHPDFVAIICMNTYGMGATRLFVGRNQLDAATMDRFVFIEWDIDPAIEASMAGVQQGSGTYDTKAGGLVTKENWLAYVRAVRKAVADSDVRHIISPRATLFGCKLIDEGVGLAVLDETVIWKGMDAEQRARVTERIPKGLRKEVVAF